MPIRPSEVDHLVVLMLENRSFDNMLGHLSLDGRNDVDGLADGMENEYRGQRYPVSPARATAIEGDLPHEPDPIDDSINGGQMDGFVRACVEQHEKDRREDPDKSFPDPSVVMSYHTADQVPVYAHLAEHFCVCDRWFSSVPGSTWPNRLFAVAGRAPAKSNRKVPIYSEESVFRLLDAAGVSWRWYGHDPGTLRAIDGEYRIGHDANFAYFNRRTWLERRHFLDDARQGRLPAVSWIDPNFVDLQVPWDQALSNDDHPPSDVLNGQQLVLDVYNAVARGPAWERTVLVVTYDEHGGFFDHVAPPEAAHDDSQFARLGVRVPALVVSPYVEPRSVAPREPVFDHTSIIRTILERFCRSADGRLPEMGPRVASAAALWPLLTRDEPRPAPLAEIDELIQAAADRAREAFVRRRAMGGIPEPEVTLELDGLQREIVGFIEEVRAQGLPANKA